MSFFFHCYHQFNHVNKENTYTTFNTPLLYLTGTPGMTGGNPLPADTGCTMPLGRGGPVNWGALIIWGGCGTSIGLLLTVGYGTGADGLVILTFCCMGGLGLEELDKVGIFIATWLAKEGSCTPGKGAAVRGIGVAGRGRTGWTGWTWFKIGGETVAFTFGGGSLGLGFVWRNEQWGFKHPLGWDSQ